ncbi:DUF4191 domain-containing protein [Paramicrobacterium chengjingii]|uniref:DUF4191 domain-containing protein n=1 Tax=Paramicrobacterium chengjingii TaxID=2769067 RepID=A0ABX6YMX2_9MICO|nr:DUF4191 domain-containing protein [Microbacterium chengjingii]QPZ40055.1 DUF4191 domain-containing protein [Microbacterium chengjingii]
MARESKRAKSPKEPGRLKQMWQVFQMTRRYDSMAQWWMLLGLVLGVAAGVLLAVLLAGGNVFMMIMWILSGLLAGLLAAMIILGRRAEKAAYSQISGQAGAVGAVFKSSLPRGWAGSEMPVNVNGRTQDAIYRAVGRGGVALVAEGPASRTKRMLDDERRKVKRVLPNVPISVFQVGPDEGSIPLYKLAKSMRKVKRELTKAEVLAVTNRLGSLNNQLPIPKGVDPYKVRPQRAR